MQINAIISLIKANLFDEAKSLLSKTRKQLEFNGDQECKALFDNLSVYFLIKDKKFEDALNKVPSNSSCFNALLRAQLLLDLKRQPDCIQELITFVKASKEAQQLIPLVFRLASNYKLLNSDTFKQFVNTLVSEQLQSKDVNVKFIESLIQIGQKEEAFRILQKIDIQSVSKDKRIMSIYLSLLSEQDLEKAVKIQSNMFVPSPSELFDAEMLEQNNWTEEDCVQKLIENAMPEKTKENKKKFDGIAA
jgi:hypothetical protein